MVNDFSEFFEEQAEIIHVDTLELRPLILLSPNIPKPLHGVNPRTIFGKKCWDETRQETYESTDFKCIACGVTRYTDEVLFRGQLHAHEVYDIYYEKQLAVFKEVIPLCEACHYGIHSGRTTALFDKGIYDEQDCWTIFERKKQICGSYGFVDERDYSKDWSKWRLGIDGVLYKPKFKSYEEWKEYYEN